MSQSKSPASSREMLEERADEAVAAKRASWKKRVNIVRLFWWVLPSLVLFDACGELANCEQRYKDGVKVKCDRAHSGPSEEMYVANSDGKIENVPSYDYGGGDIRLLRLREYTTVRYSTTAGGTFGLSPFFTVTPVLSYYSIP